MSLLADITKASPRASSATKRRYVAFSRLMQGVTFAMSGYQNPRRANLREQMIKMGAKYKPDWDDMCTHLM